jgi:single-strand DNA-binding protein
MEITGTLKLKKPIEQKGEKFRKQEFVLTDETNTQYPQHILFQLTNDKCGLIDSVPVGTKITVHFNIRGKEWKKPDESISYFNTIEAWKIVAGGNTVSAPPQQAKQENNPDIVTNQDAENDNLPF